jgi:hypothetical protein
MVVTKQVRGDAVTNFRFLLPISIVFSRIVIVFPRGHTAILRDSDDDKHHNICIPTVICMENYNSDP